jgi:hypothetical protein
MKTGVWLKLGTQPGCELIAKMADARCYYNGAGLVQAEDALVADEIIGVLRKMGVEVKRTQEPVRARLTGWTRYAVSSAIDWPKRIFS